eukprot:TRINITY_DN37567_c0_g1_i1.p1 TRINITY_DN37567_c0_g1~~TRINITY_DN37567_c0_g1_i1.p1  ORF type:complete len:287 (+),score=56.37 TRINITY_DN37567_c0_g1_i1:46-906(+)
MTAVTNGQPMPPIAELLPRPGSAPAVSRRHRSASKPNGVAGSRLSMRRSPLPIHGEPAIVKKPVVPVFAAPSPTLAVAWPTRQAKGGRSAAKLRLGSSASFGRGRTSPQAQRTQGLTMSRVRSLDLRRKPAALEPEKVVPVAEVASCAATSAPEVREPGFHLELKRVSRELGEVRRRQLSTRDRLDSYIAAKATKAASAGPEHAAEHASSFRRDVESVKTEVSGMLNDFMQDWESLQPLNDELQVLAQEADVLVDTDVRMGELLVRMSRKLDHFEQTLGSNDLAHR